MTFHHDTSINYSSRKRNDGPLRGLDVRESTLRKVINLSSHRDNEKPAQGGTQRSKLFAFFRSVKTLTLSSRCLLASCESRQTKVVNNAMPDKRLTRMWTTVCLFSYFVAREDCTQSVHSLAGWVFLSFFSMRTAVGVISELLAARARINFSSARCSIGL